jgi:two-component sensor histidine kinase
VGAAFDELVEAVGQRQAARQAAERHRDLLVEELKHRVKNTLAVVQSIAGQTFRNAAIPPNLQAAFFARLTALAAAHELLTAQNWQSADIRDVIDNALRLHCPQDRDCLRLEGPALRMQPRAALALSMALHELATNAAKYGALTNPAGTIAVRWSVARADGAPRFRLGWTEHGGPPPQKLDRKPGFGSRLVRALATELRGEVRLDYLPSGAVCTVDAPLDAVEEPASRLAA